MQFSTLYYTNMEILKPIFFYILAIYNDRISFVKHGLDPRYMLFTPFGCLDAGMVACGLYTPFATNRRHLLMVDNVSMLQTQSANIWEGSRRPPSPQTVR